MSDIHQNEKLYNALTRQNTVAQEQSIRIVAERRGELNSLTAERRRLERYQERSAAFIDTLFQSRDAVPLRSSKATSPHLVSPNFVSPNFVSPHFIFPAPLALKQLSCYASAQLPLAAVVKRQLADLSLQELDSHQSLEEALTDHLVLKRREEELQRRLRRIRAVKLSALEGE